MKRYLFLIFVLLLLPFAGVDAMIQVFPVGTFNNLHISNIEYNLVTSAGIASGLTWSGNEALRQAEVPVDGTFRNLAVRLNLAPGSGGDNYKFTLRVNGNPTTLTCTITNAELRCEDVDLGHAVSVSAGDLIALESDPGGTPTSRDS